MKASFKKNLLSIGMFAIYFGFGCGFALGWQGLMRYVKRDMVYTIVGSKVYYVSPDCSRIKDLNPVAISRFTAERMGLKPSKLCQSEGKK